MKLGCHVGMSGPLYVLGSVNEALSYGANCLMIYTGAPQNTLRKPINELKISEALKELEQNGMKGSDIVIHAPYIVNLSNPDSEKRAFAISFLSSELKRSYQIGSKLMVLHPGARLDGQLDMAINYIAYGVNQMILNTQGMDTIVLLETMAGKGSEVGRNFKELAEIIGQVNDKSRVGVCLDTCHIHDAGYDLTDFDGIIQEFDEIIGLKYLKLFHINGSKNPIGAHKDRHANIGEGYIPYELLRKIVQDERFLEIPKILETPYIDGVPPYKEEIERLKK